MNEKRDFPNCHKVKRPALTGHKYKEWFETRATKSKTSDYLQGRKDQQFQGDVHVTKATNSSEGGQVICQKPNSPCESQRMVSKWTQQSCSNDETPSIRDILTTSCEIEKESPAVVNLNSMIAQDHHAYAAGSLQRNQIRDEQQICVTCGHGEELLHCAGKGCGRSFHLSCITPPFTYVPPGVWHCIWCIKRKIDVDVYAVSEGIELILDVMLDVSDDEGKQKQKKYLVKYKGLAHIHNRWVPWKTLVLESPSLSLRYKQRHKKVSWRKEWCVPQRLLAKRFLLFPDQSNGTCHQNSNCHYEWLVKWTGLGYDHATWELETASFLRTPEALKLINDFLFLHSKAGNFEEDKIRKAAFSELPELPFGCQDQEHVLHVNKLLEYWHRDQNALVIDNQERVVRVVLFVVTLLKETRGPFLIVTSPSALSIWEAEFSHRVSHANVVVYKGSRSARSIIRTFEFYNENGKIMFQVLVSCCADVAQDIETFKNINWEVIILDGCQHPKMVTHFDQIKFLAASMRLLLVHTQIKDWSFNCHNVLCFLDPLYEKDNVDANPSSNACKLKERLVNFVAYDCQSEKIKFVEFWVPAMLTNVQTEQYCASLFSKSVLLCSSLKGDSTGSLHDILVSTRKCCDHPFLADWSLRSVVLQGIPTADHFNVEIQLSGKLQLLNKILSEIKRRGLRVVIFFQSLASSGTFSIGDILDDFIHQKFGEDTYVRIDGNISRAKKQAACDMFNHKDSGKFFCLIEARACTPSTKLSSVDAIVIYNSDWDPHNDIKALEKITIDSKFKEMNIFRLYTSCTVEEKVLILAKEGVILDSNIKEMRRCICHKLLSWGASCLFRKIDASTEFMASSLDTINTADSLLENVFQELLCLLPHGSLECNSIDCFVAKPNSIHVLRAQQNEGIYFGGFLLHGELIIQSKDNFSIVRHLIDTEPPRIFWTNLLEGKQPRWKYMTSPSQRTKRKDKYLDDLLRETEDEVPKKKAMAAASAIDNFHPRSGFITKRPRSSAPKRYTRVSNLASNVRPSTCDLEETGFARDYARNIQQHSEAVNLSILTAPVNDNYPGGEPDSPAEWCSIPDQLSLSSNSMSIGDCAVDVSISISGGIQNGHTGSSEGYACQGQAPLDASRQGLSCASVYSIQQSVQNWAPQSSVASTKGSSSSAASLGHRNTVHYSGGHPAETSVSNESASLEKLMKNMQEGKRRTVKLHNDLKLHIEPERKMEIEEVNKKYDVLILNAENAIAKTKKYYESCFNLVHEHKLIAEATSQFEELDRISANGPLAEWEGLSPEEPQICGMTNVSAVQLAATRDHASPPEQDFVALHSSNPASIPSVQVLQQSSEPPQCSAKTSAGEAQSSANLGINSSSTTPGEPTNVYHPRPPPIPNISVTRNINSGRQLRAPAPHLRHSRGPPALAALNIPPAI